MLILVRKDLIDLFADVRASGGDLFCGGVVAAFTLFGRMHILSRASSCEGDAFSYDVIHDLSGPMPKLVFH
jgi:hypothetical protein